MGTTIQEQLPGVMKDVLFRTAAAVVVWLVATGIGCFFIKIMSVDGETVRFIFIPLAVLLGLAVTIFSLVLFAIFATEPE